jgi:glycerol-3-phosphate dehydrogenase
MMADRISLLDKLKKAETFDLLVIGGGATGCGIALDAASRGLSVALVERGDFASGTSGRSTKLIHGGVRYLEAALLHVDPVQFNLVRDALHEREVLLHIAPHLCHRLSFVIPVYSWLEMPYLFSGLKLYDLLAGKSGLGGSRLVGREEALQLAPMLKRQGLKGGLVYFDGQFNDARMNLALALGAIEEGAAVVNYLQAVGLCKEDGRVVGALVQESLGGDSWQIRARCVVNACGPFGDALRLMDEPDASPLLAVSSGVHMVLDRRFAPPEAGITIPKTEDGRVLFILPWQGHCLVGTTDRPAEPCRHPVVEEEDIAYLLRHLHRHFDLQVERSDIRAAWAGLRPLLKNPETRGTAALARDHQLSVSASGLISIMGGKWTTYRKMAEDAVDLAVKQAGLAADNGCRTDRIVLPGGETFSAQAAGQLQSRFGLSAEEASHLNGSYGDRAPEVALLCLGPLRERVAPGHPYLMGEILYAVRREMAQSAADVLVRRLPLALLDQSAAREAAPGVLELMSRELAWDANRLENERRELFARLDGAL